MHVLSRHAVTVGLLVLATPSALAEELWVPTEVLLASECVVDPEISPEEDMMSWQDYCTNELWVADLDPITGQWQVPGGRQYFIADHLLTTERSKNAGEWGRSQRGWELWFTREGPNGRGVVSMALGVPEDPVVYDLTRGGVSLEGDGAPFPSDEVQDPYTRVAYYHHRGPDLSVWWADVQQPGPPRSRTWSPQHVEGVQAVVYKGPRWIPGERALVVTKVPDAGSLPAQAFRYDVDTERFTQLTADPSPVVDGQIVTTSTPSTSFLVASLDGRGVIVYRSERGGPYLEEKRLFLPEADGPEHGVFLFEPFLFQDRLFVVAQISQPEGPFTPSTIRIACGEDGDDLDIPVCDQREGVTRFDPEAYVTEGAVHAYYYDVERHGLHLCPTPLGDLYGQE